MLPLLTLALPALSSLVRPIAEKFINTLGGTASSVINHAVNQATSSTQDIGQNSQQTKNKIFF